MGMPPVFPSVLFPAMMPLRLSIKVVEN